MSSSEKSHNLSIIGSTEYVEIAGIKNIPAKVDTGADSSAIWASSINMQEDGALTFCLFGQKSPLYTGERLKTTDYTARVIRSSHGDEQIRYRVSLPVTISGQTFKTTFTLANRSRNNFPVLIGRRTIEGKYLVDVSKTNVIRRSNPKTTNLNQERKADLYEFHQKYIKKERSFE